jgi:hypothetical protein
VTGKMTKEEDIGIEMEEDGGYVEEYDEEDEEEEEENQFVESESILDSDDDEEVNLNEVRDVSIIERSELDDESEQLRYQYEEKIKQIIHSALLHLPHEQLEFFNNFLLEEQSSFHSKFLSQEVNTIFIRNIRKTMKKELKYEILTKQHESTFLESVSKDSTEGKETIEQKKPSLSDEDRNNMSRLSILSISENLLPSQRKLFYDYCQKAIHCISKESKQDDGFYIQMIIEWNILPFHPFSLAGEEAKEDDRVRSEEANHPLPAESDMNGFPTPRSIFFSCHYRGDNEGNGSYGWECCQKHQEIENYSNNYELRLSEKYNIISNTIGLTLEETSQLFTWMFRSSFWNDV